MRPINMVHNMQHNIAAVMPHRERNARRNDGLNAPL
jgi:phosphoribosylformylglycinamidine (FGAM) synthase-like amidotransferase family enzyme